MTVEEHLKFYAEVKGVSSSEVKRNMNEYVVAVLYSSPFSLNFSLLFSSWNNSARCLQCLIVVCLRFLYFHVLGMFVPTGGLFKEVEY